MIGNTGTVKYRPPKHAWIAVVALAASFILLILPTGCRNPFAYRRPAPPRPVPVPRVPTTPCPIDGRPITTELLLQRPLAVMIENSPDARPQNGVNDACVVYEAITEGGITRFLAIYYHGAPKMIGPVRSARPHFIDLAREYDAAFVHCGQSQEALEMLTSTPQIYNLDQMKYGKPFRRDRSRAAPHNLYTSADKLRALVKQQRWGGSPAVLPIFTSDRMLTDGAPAETIDIDFHGGVKYKLRLVYDAGRGGYLRYMDGKLQTDRETGEPAVAKNILIQRVYSRQFPGSKYHTYDVTVTGSGGGIFISNRRQIPMQWSKTWDGAITSYTDAGGNALPFQSGQTWIEVLPMEGKVSINGPRTAAH